MDFWCHACSQVIVPNFGADMCCPRCNGGFIEQIDSPEQEREDPTPEIDPRMLALFASSGFRRNRDETASGDVHPSPARLPFLEILQALANASIRSENAEEQGANNDNNDRIIVVDPSGVPLMMLGGEMSTGGATLGDYFVGSGLESLIQRLMENDPNRYGTPPAASSAVEALPRVTISESHLQDDCSSECSVCKEDYAVGEETLELPCKHLFHPDCILPWLKMHSSCPVCRFQMPAESNTDAAADANPSSSATDNTANAASATNNNSESSERGGENQSSHGHGWAQRLISQLLGTLGAANSEEPSEASPRDRSASQ